MVMLPPVVPIQSQPPRRELDRWRCVGFQAGCSRRGSRNSLLEARKAFHQLRRPWAWLSAVISCSASAASHRQGASRPTLSLVRKRGRQRDGTPGSVRSSVLRSDVDDDRAARSPPPSPSKKNAHAFVYEVLEAASESNTVLGTFAG
jgi:hypothetical protein